MRELPSYEKMYRQLKARGFVFLAVNIQEPRGVVEAWARREEATFPILLDRDGAITRAYRVTGTPTVYLVDRKARFVGWYVGTKDLWSVEGQRLLEALLGEPGP
jgi:peroxiredoxin